MPTLAAIIAGLALALPLLALAAPPAITPQPFITGLSAPVEVAHANDGTGRLFVVEQAGRIRVVRNGALLATPFLDLRAAAGGPVRAGGEQGLLGLAFHPHYASNGRLFVYYTRNLAGDNVGSEIVVAGYSRSAGNADVANAASGLPLLVIPHPQQANHNGGKIAFGPDGYLYVAVGDGGGGGDPFHAGQSLNDMRGKLLRIDVDNPGGYAVPRSNPLVRFGSQYQVQIWDYGLRNPWKFSFDRATGDLFIGDVGQNAWEEINFEPRNSGGLRNYGWSVFEGSHCFPASTPSCSLGNHTLPILEYDHGSGGGLSVTGGYRYRGTSLPALAGYYVYGDYVSGRIWAASPDGGGTWSTTLVGSLSTLSTFGEDEYGELYAASRDAGTLLRVTPAATPPSTGSPIQRYRLYHAGTRNHLYTVDANEYATLPQCCGWQAEGAAHRLFAGPGTQAGVTAVPYYRLYNPASQQHHWTTDANENATLPSFGWQQEGAAGFILPSIASGTVPLYRLYHPGEGLHVWTTDVNERWTLQHAHGWVDEGISGYVLP